MFMRFRFLERKSMVTSNKQLFVVDFCSLLENDRHDEVCCARLSKWIRIGIVNKVPFMQRHLLKKLKNLNVVIKKNSAIGQANLKVA